MRSADARSFLVVFNPAWLPRSAGGCNLYRSLSWLDCSPQARTSVLEWLVGRGTRTKIIWMINPGCSSNHAWDKRRGARPAFVSSRVLVVPQTRTPVGHSLNFTFRQPLLHLITLKARWVFNCHLMFLLNKKCVSANEPPWIPYLPTCKSNIARETFFLGKREVWFFFRSQPRLQVLKFQNLLTCVDVPWTCLSGW